MRVCPSVGEPPNESEDAVERGEGRRPQNNERRRKGRAPRRGQRTKGTRKGLLEIAEATPQRIQLGHVRRLLKEGGEVGGGREEQHERRPQELRR